MGSRNTGGEEGLRRPFWEAGAEEDGLHFFEEQRQRLDRGVLQGPGNLKTVFSLPLS